MVPSGPRTGTHGGARRHMRGELRLRWGSHIHTVASFCFLGPIYFRCQDVRGKDDRGRTAGRTHARRLCEPARRPKEGVHQTLSLACG